VALPLLTSSLVSGLALRSLLGPHGLLGPWLRTVGVAVPSSPAAVVLAQAFVALPFLVLVAEWSLRRTGVAIERAAASLGARRWRILVSVTLPAAGPAIALGTVLVFARAVGEFGAVSLFAGDVAGATRTVPLAVWDGADGTAAAAVGGVSAALALVLLVVALAVVLALRGWRGAAPRPDVAGIAGTGAGR
jgi:molybdate transport system permease protein